MRILRLFIVFGNGKYSNGQLYNCVPEAGEGQGQVITPHSICGM